jgi:hypothetical protein
MSPWLPNDYPHIKHALLPNRAATPWGDQLLPSPVHRLTQQPLTAMTEVLNGRDVWRKITAFSSLGEGEQASSETSRLAHRQTQFCQHGRKISSVRSLCFARFAYLIVSSAIPGA